MSLIIETGSIIDNANSYATAADFTSVVVARGLGVDLEETEIEQYLLRASDYLESLTWKGTITSSDQSLCFPRQNIADVNCNPIDENTIPKALIKAQLWLAFHISEDKDPSAVPEAGIKRERVEGAVEVEYKNSQVKDRIDIKDMPNVWYSIRHLLVGNGFGITGQIDRA